MVTVNDLRQIAGWHQMVKLVNPMIMVNWKSKGCGLILASWGVEKLQNVHRLCSIALELGQSDFVNASGQ